jgi:outer membrane immunogenic protein
MTVQTSRRLAGVIVFACGLAVVGGAASAADLAARPYTKAPPPVIEQPYDWTGFYIGANLGGAWGSSDFDFLPGPQWAPASQVALGRDGAAQLKSSNVSGGVQAGYNWQINRAVLGFEGDFQYIGLSAMNSFTQNGTLPTLVTPYVFTETARSNWLATVRGRIGFTADHVLFYGTGGLAIADSRSSDTLAFPTLSPAATFTGVGARSDTLLGWTAGGGIEWAFARNWSVKGEYLFAQFDRTTTAMSTIGATFTQSYSDRLKLNVARVGVNYHFGGPVVAKY